MDTWIKLIINIQTYNGVLNIILMYVKETEVWIDFWTRFTFLSQWSSAAKKVTSLIRKMFLFVLPKHFLMRAKLNKPHDEGKTYTTVRMTCRSSKNITNTKNTDQMFFPLLWMDYIKHDAIKNKNIHQYKYICIMYIWFY